MPSVLEAEPPAVQRAGHRSIADNAVAQRRSGVGTNIVNRVILPLVEKDGDHLTVDVENSPFALWNLTDPGHRLKRCACQEKTSRKPTGLIALAAGRVGLHHNGLCRPSEVPLIEPEGESPMDASPPPSQPPKLDPPVAEHIQGVKVDIDVSGDDELDKTLAKLEMAGEEAAAGFKPAPHRPLAPEVRYLHISRTIHELITDRNRSVGIFLFVASVLFAASTALLNAKPLGRLIIPLEAIQYWCLPITFGTLTVLGKFISLILIRARIGLIYEVSKMNALLGLPSERVRRVNPLSIFFLMYSLVVWLSAACAGLTVGMLAIWWGTRAQDGSGSRPYGDLISVENAQSMGIVPGLLAAFLYLAFFHLAYFVLVLRATTDGKMESTIKS